MRQVEFLRQYSNYIKGQVAVFSDSAAEGLVKAKVAKPFLPKLGQSPKRDAIKNMFKK